MTDGYCDSISPLQFRLVPTLSTRLPVDILIFHSHQLHSIIISPYSTPHIVCALVSLFCFHRFSKQQYLAPTATIFTPNRYLPGQTTLVKSFAIRRCSAFPIRLGSRQASTQIAALVLRRTVAALPTKRRFATSQLETFD